MGHAVYSSLTEDNLKKCCQELKEMHPDKLVLVAGQDQKHLDTPEKGNASKIKAYAAAKAVDGQAVFPTFPRAEVEKHPEKCTSFNQLVKTEDGKDTIRAQINASIELKQQRQKAAAENTKDRGASKHDAEKPASKDKEGRSR